MVTISSRKLQTSLIAKVLNWQRDWVGNQINLNEVMAKQMNQWSLLPFLEPKLVDEIRQATNGNYVLGNAEFVQQIENALDKRA